MFESFGFEETTAKQASVLFALGLGALFGLLAERTKFCFRRSIVGTDRRAALGVWLTALAVAVLGTQAAVAFGLISFDGHRFLASELPVVAIVAGGAIFGAGMVLTRGCVSRLTVLSGTGNLRAVLVMVIFAIAAHATLKGVLAPLRTGLGSMTIELGAYSSLAALPGGTWFWTALISVPMLLFAARSRNRVSHLAMAAAIGVLVPVAWVGTGYVLLDEFDPIAMESLSFTSPSAEALFFTIASTSIPAGFGTGLLGGVVLGALVASLLFGSFQWQSFETPRQTGRYAAGAVMMGIGGVLAGGCTVGAGLSGIPTLSVAALLAIAGVVLGALSMNRLVTRSGREFGGPEARQPLQPAE